MTALTFRVPLPPRDLSPNGQGASRRRWKAVAFDTYKQEVKVLALDACRRAKWVPPSRARVSLVFGLKGSRGVQRYAPQDVDNAVSSAKALFDAASSAECWLGGDTWEHLSLGEITATRTAGPWIDVKVEVLDAE